MPPKAPLTSRIGASVPPDVPDPSAIHHAMSLPTSSTASSTDRDAVGEDVVDRVVADTEPAAAGPTSPTAGEPSAPMIGCQNSRHGKRRKPASRRYRPCQISTASKPHAIPITANTGSVGSPA